MEKPTLNILWLDDQRNPNRYFLKKDNKEWGTLHDTFNFYKKLQESYDLKFIWVKTYEEFVKYIMNNGIPEFVSFDHDLSKTSLPTDPKGVDCAIWLVRYCNKLGCSIPPNYVHSANKKWRDIIRNILNGSIDIMKTQITEGDLKNIVNNIMVQLLREDVYADKALQNAKKGTMGLTYKKHQKKNAGNFSSIDMLKTDKMDEESEDTYIVPLKGGINSYNITSINGSEVMHYFKRKFNNSHEKTILKGGGAEWELDMEDEEWNKFMITFNHKVDRVINHCIKEFRHDNSEFEVRAVSIYPVPSSSNFNKSMAEGMSRMYLAGLPTQVISSDLLKKDLRNLERDEDFISKNKEYYNSPMSNSPDEKMRNSVSTFLDNDILRLKAFSEAKKYVGLMNFHEKKLLEAWNNYKVSLKVKGVGSEKTLQTIVDNYKAYYDAMISLTKMSKYVNLLDGGKESGFYLDTLVSALKYTKGPSIDGRSGALWQLIKNHKDIRGHKSPVNGAPYKKVDINLWVPNEFQIKKLTNGERMGLKGYYNQNEDYKFVEEELAKIKGTVFVIFDDNISGGATLSDICYQCKQMGIEYIIPITFGQMNTKWKLNAIPLTRPTNNKGEEGFNYS